MLIPPSEMARWYVAPNKYCGSLCRFQMDVSVPVKKINGGQYQSSSRLVCEVKGEEASGQPPHYRDGW